ncbi:MAG: glycosyltransferase [Lachnospiraceae bacterium]|nr:glycosyltransferase [Lachnospiraceae bacterium]
MEISVIVPIYNVEKYLSKCIDSILQQTFTDYELILVDDGSTDTSGKIADDYAAKDNRITVIHKKNGGLSDARNHGLDKATGDYICFIDSDDWIEKNYLQELLGLAQNNEADIAICAYQKSDGNIAVSQPAEPGVIIETGIEAIDNLYSDRYGIYVVAWNKLYNRKLFEETRYPVGLIHEDEAVFGDLFLKAKKVIRTERILYNYRVNNITSIMSSNYSLKRLDILKAMEKRMETYKINGLQKYYEKDSFKYLYKILLNEIEIKRLKEDNRAVIKELKKKYWIKYKEALKFKWNMKRKIAMFIFGIFPKAYLLRHKES